MRKEDFLKLLDPHEEVKLIFLGKLHESDKVVSAFVLTNLRIFKNAKSFINLHDIEDITLDIGYFDRVNIDINGSTIHLYTDKNKELYELLK